MGILRLSTSADFTDLASFQISTITWRFYMVVVTAIAHLQTSFLLQIQNAQAAGAAALLIVNTDAFSPGYFSMTGGTAAGSVNIPAGSLPKAIGAILYAALKGKTAVQLSFAVVSD